MDIHVLASVLTTLSGFYNTSCHCNIFKCYLHSPIKLDFLTNKITGFPEKIIKRKLFLFVCKADAFDDFIGGLKSRHLEGCLILSL